MTAKQQVVWTVLPQGFSAPGTLRFTVLVSPRLGFTSPQANQTVSQFPDWMDWPKTLGNSKFGLVVDGNVGAPVLLHPKAGPDSAVWTAMVTPSTRVDDFKFTDFRAKILLSYPVALLAKTIEATYAVLGAAATSALPTRAQMPDLIGRLGEQSDTPKSSAARQVLAQLKNPNTSGAYYTNPRQALQLLKVYHQPLNASTTQTNPKHGAREKVTWNKAVHKILPTPAQLAQSIDFHKIVSSVIDHHDVARWMGMVLEFEVPASAVPDGLHTLRLVVDRGITPSPDIYPQTQIAKAAAVFEAAPKALPSPLAGRFMNLQAKGMDLVQLDVDGGGLKLQNFAEALPHMRASAHDDEDFDVDPVVRAGAPSLRTAGLMLAHARRDLATAASFDVMGALQDAVDHNTPMPVLHAEDLVRGYRVDINDLTTAPGKWRSLMQRTVDFTFINSGFSRLQHPEEGMMRLSGGSSTDGANPDVLKIHEGVFVWRGWSLVAPEPFQALAKDTPRDATAANPNPPPAPSPPIQDPQGDPPPAGLPLKTTYAATKGTLPSLRFGRRYSVRLRAVDLSGESLAPDAGNPSLQAVSDPVVFRRYEPVAPPALALPAHGGTPVVVADGESMGIAAVRTFNVKFDDPTVNTATAARLLAAPRVSVRFAEPHGVLDTPAGKIDPAKYGQLLGLDKDFAVTPAGGKPPQYAMAEIGAGLPYPPDPMAIGVAIRIAGINGINPDTVFKIPLYGPVFDPAVKPDWPNALTFQIVGSETFAEPKFDPGQRVFMVPLAKGERAILRLSSIIAPGKLEQMQLAVLIAVAATQNQAQLLKMMEDGQHWMLTPWSELRLVHAVQKPLIMPDLAGLAVDRQSLGELDAPISGFTPLSGHSTGRIDMKAHWSEPDDDPQDTLASTGPAAIAHTQHVFDRTIARSDGPTKYSLRGAIHAFHDTRYRRVIYELAATSRYREYMTDTIRSKPGAMTITSKEARRWIPSTAPPPPPQLLYVVPTFGWSRQGDTNQQVSLRAGGGLRVYLDRPWFATGFGEMLAVVLPGPEITTSDLEGDLKTHVTQWGRDPAWTSSAINNPAPDRTAAAFPLAAWSGPIGFDASGGTAALPPDVVSTFQAEHADLPPGAFQVTGFTAPTVPAGKTLQIAPHAVGYDADRQLWYCDIVVRPPDQAYYPFIRLALARYQPTSAQGAHLSGIVTTEFQQLSPDRLAVVTKTASGLSTLVNVSVYGYAPADARAVDSAKAGVFSAKTQVLDGGADPDLDWRDLAGQPTLVAQPVLGGRNVVARQLTLPAPAAAPSPPLLQVEEAVHLSPNYSVPAPLQAQFGAAKLAVISAAGLAGLLGPGLLWNWRGYLPPTPAGGRRRVLITESESYITAAADMPHGPSVTTPHALRIIYAEAVEI